MASARFAWGIDVGNRALKAVRLSRGPDGALRVDDFEVIEHENVLSNAGDNRESLVQSAIANFIQRHSIKGGVAAIGVGGGFARFIKLPPVEPNKIPEIVKFEAIQQIPFPLDDVEWSYQLFQEPESPDVEVGIFAMRKDLINRHIQYFTDVELNVQYVQLNPLSVYNAMAYDQRVKGTTMIMDVGAETTELIIADGETIWLRSIPIGGNNFTETLVKSFKLPFPKAEELKRSAATNKYAKRIFQEMRPVFADLVAEVQRSIGFYASVHRESRIKRVLAVGGTFRLPGLQKYLQQNLQLPVEKVERISAPPPADGKLATTLNENLLSVIGAYGLAVQAMGDAKVTSSLLPERIRRAKMWRDKTKWFAATAAAFVVGTGVAMGMAYYHDWQYQAQEQPRGHTDQVVQQARKLDADWTTRVEQAGATDRMKINNVRSMVNYRGLWGELLADIQSCLPVPQEALLSNDREKIKSIPRGDRNEIQIDKLTSRYVPDLAAALAPTGAAAAAAAAAPPPPPVAPGAPSAPGAPGTPGAPGAPGAPAADAPFQIPAGARGLILTLDVTTPHKDGYPFVLSTFAKSLTALGQAWHDRPENQNKKYLVAKVQVNSPRQVKDDPNRLQAIEASYAAALAAQGSKTPNGGLPYGGGGYPGGMPGGYPGMPPGYPGGMPPGYPGMPPGYPGAATATPGAPDQPDPNAPFYDRVTGEDVRNDWEVTVEIDVMLDPAPPAGTPAAAGVTKTAAAQ